MRNVIGYLLLKFPKVFRDSIQFYGLNLPRAFQFMRLHFDVRGFTHVSTGDLLHLHKFVHDLSSEGVNGDIVECGAWRGGSSALMWKTSQKLGMNNSIYIYDSFEGFPKPQDASIDGVKAQEINTGRFNWIKADLNDVIRVMKKINAYSERVHITKGWFHETTPSSPVRRIALLHCDGDLYESTKTTLDSFYDKVVPGGYVVSNDYGDTWIGAKKAFDELIAAKCPGVALKRVPGGGAYFRKPS